MTTELQANTEPGMPLGLGCNEGLGPLPTMPAPSDTHRIGALMCAFTAADMEAYAKTAMHVMRERCVKLCEQEADRWRGEQDITDFRLCAARIRSEV